MGESQAKRGMHATYITYRTAQVFTHYDISDPQFHDLPFTVDKIPHMDYMSTIYMVYYIVLPDGDPCDLHDLLSGACFPWAESVPRISRKIYHND